MKALPFRGVLFDFDGVIADSSVANFQAWHQAFQELGVFILPEDYFLLEGMKPLEVAGKLAEKHGLKNLIIEKTASLKERFFLEGNACPLFPGALPLISNLRSAGKLVALVTGSSKKRLEATLQPNVLAMFNACITADNVARGKPAPDPFAKAAEILKLSSVDCVVVENAPLGILSAKRAGMRCIAVCSTLGEEFLSDADFIALNLVEVARLLLP